MSNRPPQKSTSGIEVSDSFKRNYSSIKADIANRVRFIKIQIKDEELVDVHTEKKSSTWTSDFNKLQKYLDEKEPSFFLYFKDKKDDLLLISFVPESTSVKDKMVYSSSKGALMSIFGLDTDQYYCTAKQEVSYEAYNKQKSIKGPMSYVEEQLALSSNAEKAEMKTEGLHKLASVVNSSALNEAKAKRAASPKPPYQKQ